MRLVVHSSFVLLCFTFLALSAAAQTRTGLDAPNGYRIQQGDKLSVKFFNNPDLNEPSVTVRPDGFITLQLVNDVKAEGLTAAELKKSLEKAYDETLLEPIITVSVIDFVAPHVFVAGQINKPGRYELRDARTLMQAIFLAGGFTRDANRKMVIHARPDGKGDWIISSADVMSMIDPKRRKSDVELRSGDYLYIPESRIAKFNRAVETFRGLLPRFF